MIVQMIPLSDFISEEEWKKLSEEEQKSVLQERRRQSSLKFLGKDDPDYGKEGYLPDEMVIEPFRKFNKLPPEEQDQVASKIHEAYQRIYSKEEAG